MTATPTSASCPCGPSNASAWLQQGALGPPCPEKTSVEMWLDGADASMGCPILSSGLARVRQAMPITDDERVIPSNHPFHPTWPDLTKGGSQDEVLEVLEAFFANEA